MTTVKKSVERVWFALFDVEYVDHSISRIRSMFSALRPGQGFDEARTIRRLLIEPIDAYLDEHCRPKGTTTNVRVAERLRDELEGLCETLCDLSPVRELDSALCVLVLRPLWLEFIAVHAAPLVWYVPLQVQRHMQKIAQNFRVAPDLTLEAIAAFVNANQDAKKNTVIAALRERQAFFDFAAGCPIPAVAEAIRALGLAHGVTPSTSSFGDLHSMLTDARAGKFSPADCPVELTEKHRNVLDQVHELHAQLSDEKGTRPISKRQLSDRLKAAENARLIVKPKKLSKTAARKQR